MKEQYVLTLNRPRGISISEMKSYIADSVGSWANGGHPESPLFNFKKNLLSVKRATHKAKASGIMTQPIPSETLDSERYVGGLRAANAKTLTALKDIILWAERHGLTKAELITGGQAEVPVITNARAAVAVAEALGLPKSHVAITIHVEGGLVQDVTGIPAGVEVRVEDRDGDGDTSHSSWDEEKGCFVTAYGGDGV